MIKFSFWFLMSFLFFSQSFAQTERVSHLLSVGQGIASPSVTTTINFSNGTTSENPVGTMYQEGFRITGEFAQGETATTSPDGFGAELGYGGPGWGFAVGTFKFDCDNCKELSSAAVSLEVANWFAFGLRFQEEVYTVGGILNSSGNFRVGFVAELFDPEGDDNNISSYGLGFAWVAHDFTIVVDASTYDTENVLSESDVIFVTPGVNFHVGMLQISANYRMFVNDENDIYAQADNLWFGIGVGDSAWHIGFYSDYVRDTALEVSLFF